MKKGILVFFLWLIYITAICQKTNLEIVTKGPALKFNNGTHTITLFFMTGFDDTVSLYLNKKLILHQFIKSLSRSDDRFISYDISVNFKARNILLELTKIKSNKIYSTYFVKGYGFVIFYLENDNSIVYTNRAPMEQ